MRLLIILFVGLPSAGVTASPHADAANWKVGVSRADITPTKSLWLAGYASRKRPAEGAIHPLWAKALAIEDAEANRLVIMTLDLIGDNFGRDLADRVRTRIVEATPLSHKEILFNFSHTHSGPVTRLNDGATVTYALDTRQQAAVKEYTKALEDGLVQLVVRAMANTQPARLEYGQSRATFAANRRTQHNPNGPVDHTVPILLVRDATGKLMAVLFGYACHTAALTGEFHRYSGDYAGFAQIALEQAHPGSTALFMMGCGGDANPSPRGQLALARQHGETLAAAVESVIGQPLLELQGPLTVRFARTDLEFVRPPSQAELEARRGQGDIYEQRLTDVLLQRIRQRGQLDSSYPFPIHVVRFGHQLSLVALSGETVVDYALRLRRELQGSPLWVAGYCNEVFAYVPSERVLAEGGYEGGGAMRYFGIHGPFRPGLEDRIVALARRLMEE